jgi:hypothetical protein
MPAVLSGACGLARPRISFIVVFAPGRPMICPPTLIADLAGETKMTAREAFVIAFFAIHAVSANAQVVPLDPDVPLTFTITGSLGEEDDGGGGGGFSDAYLPAPMISPMTRANTNRTAPADTPPADRNSEAKLCPGEGTSGSGNPSAGNPVIVATGEKWKAETDFESFGNYGLSLTRTYRSTNAYGVLLGPQWSTNLDPIKLAPGGGCRQTDTGCYANYVTMYMPGGTKYVYTLHPDAEYWTSSNSTALGRLDWSSGSNTYALRRERLVYRFDGFGYLTSVSTDTTPALRLLTYNYSSRGVVSSIVNAVGQSVVFTWTNGRVTQVTDTAGKVWTYGCTAGVAPMLNSVRPPGATVPTRTFHYEDPNYSHLLTGISVADSAGNNVRHSTYRYDTSGRVVRSELAGGEQADTFVYGATTTTVTSALGQPVVYTFESTPAGRRLVSTSRQATSTCAAAGSALTYDGNGYVATTSDWRGNATETVHDAAGRVQRVTVAAGTPAAHTTSHAWQTGDLVYETQFKGSGGIAYAKVNYTYFTSGLAKDKLASETWT